MHAADARSNVINNLYPVIVVQLDMSGGTFTLVQRNKKTTVQPVDPIFERAKSITHVPLTIYMILATYLKNPEESSSLWVPKLSQFNIKVKESQVQLKKMHNDSHLPKDVYQWSLTILEASQAFIEKIVSAKNFTLEEFKQFTNSVFDATVGNLQAAATVQVQSVTKLLNQWKEELGEQEWKNMYTVVLSVYTTQIENQHFTILREHVNQDRLFVVPIGSIQENTIQTALHNLAGIIQDRVISDLLFAKETQEGQKMRELQASPEDLLGYFVKKSLKL